MTSIFFNCQHRKSEEITFDGLNLHVWHCRDKSKLPSDLNSLRLRIWQIFSFTGIFKSDAFSIFSLTHENLLVSHACVLPKYFRFPFMHENDLQISSIWTHPDYRQQGLATKIVKSIIQDDAFQNRTFWYITNKKNIASIKVAEKANLKRIGTGKRFKRYGIKLLGFFDLVDKDLSAN